MLGNSVLTVKHGANVFSQFLTAGRTFRVVDDPEWSKKTGLVDTQTFVSTASMGKPLY
jgi:hypothetical protein